MFKLNTKIVKYMRILTLIVVIFMLISFIFYDAGTSPSQKIADIENNK